MDRREKIVLLAALAAMLLMTIFPPVTSMSYDNSGGMVRISPVIHYEFLFSKSSAEINFFRLLLQYLIVLIASKGLILLRKKTAASNVMRVADLRATNDKLLQVIAKGKNGGEQLRQHTAQLTAAKENLGCQINDLKPAEAKWHTCRDQLEQDLKERASELNRANEQLEKQIAQCRQLEERLRHQMQKLEDAEECFDKQAAELAAVKEQLQQQTRERENVERQLGESRKLFSEQSAQMDKHNERPHEKMNDSEALPQSGEGHEKSELPSTLFNVKEMKRLAELAKRLARK